MNPIVEWMIALLLAASAASGDAPEATHEPILTPSSEAELTPPYEAAIEATGDATWAATWEEVTYCESTHDPHAVGAAGERGHGQIHPIHRSLIRSLGLTWDAMFDPVANAIVGYEVWLRQGWDAWACAR